MDSLRKAVGNDGTVTSVEKGAIITLTRGKISKELQRLLRWVFRIVSKEEKVTSAGNHLEIQVIKRNHERKKILFLLLVIFVVLGLVLWYFFAYKGFVCKSRFCKIPMS